MSEDKYHGVGKFNVLTGKQKSKSANKTYTNIFSDTLIKLARKDKKICAITAAMPTGTGLDKFKKTFPKRTFDVGIAEQHAVTFAAGLAAEGLKPFATIYSTFLQRAYDQIIHDVAIQNLPVRFTIDRAGLVGADGPTHAGSFDVAFLSNLPNFITMAASDEQELANMIKTCANIAHAPSAVRYPRGEIIGLSKILSPKILKIGKGRIIKEGTDVALFSYGTRLQECIKASNILENNGISCTIADARFCKPLDKKLLFRLAKEHKLLLTIEEGAIGGFGSHVLHTLIDNNKLNHGLRLQTMRLPDSFLDHDTPEKMYVSAKLNHSYIAKKVLATLKSM